MKQIDLNCDMGESYGIFKIGNDREVLDFVSSANVACGYHAGDHNVMMETVKEASRLGVRIGAHPGFPDLHGFGRREMRLPQKEIYNLVIYQIGALASFAKVNGVRLAHVKPHGALYNMAAADKQAADAIAAAVADFDKNLVLFGLAGSQLTAAGREKGLRVASEVFADRTYQRDGSLTPRSMEGALIHDSDTAVRQALRMVKEGKAFAADGTDIPVAADTICIHGDGPGALLFAKKLAAAFADEGIMLRNSWDDF